MNLTLRSVEAADTPLLLELYASTRALEMAQVPWTEEQKRAFVQMQFEAQLRSYAATHPQAKHELICRDGQPVGRTYVSREADRIHILDITVAPTERNGGIGSQVLCELLKEADAAGQPVSIYVETYNPSLRLFERLGFSVQKVEGLHALLERTPAQAVAS